jgi:hypothetical protein
MSVSIGEQSFQYVGIVNGVMYRIDPLSGRSLEPMFGAQPFKKWSDYPTIDAPAQSSDAGPSESGRGPLRPACRRPLHPLSAQRRGATARRAS